jgi:methylthioribose-1-phosphate isomerase
MYSGSEGRSSKKAKTLGSATIVVQGLVNELLFDLLKSKDVKEVVVLEGRPSLEAARSNCRALVKRKMKPVLIADNMAGFLFFKKRVKEVWLAYYEADKQGALCDIGASILGILAKQHKLPVNLFPAAKKPKSVGKEKDLFSFNGERVAPPKIKGYVPLTERLPEKYITNIFVPHCDCGSADCAS